MAKKSVRLSVRGQQKKGKKGKVEKFVMISASAGGADNHPEGKERKIVRIVPAHRVKLEREKLLVDAFHERYKDYREGKLRKMQDFTTLRYVLYILLVIFIVMFILMVSYR